MFAFEICCLYDVILSRVTRNCRSVNGRVRPRGTYIMCIIIEDCRKINSFSRVVLRRHFGISHKSHFQSNVDTFQRFLQSKHHSSLSASRIPFPSKNSHLATHFHATTPFTLVETESNTERQRYFLIV